jgi:tetratricopeptide (TPR) repeat protein
MLEEHEQALKAAERCRRQHHETTFCLTHLTRVLAALGRIEELNAVLDELVNESDLDQIRRALREAFQILRVNGHTDAAEEVLRRAISWYEARPSAEAATVDHRWWYAWMLYYADDLVDAQEILDELVEDYPDNVNYRGGRGFIAATRGDSALARKDAEWLANLDRLHLDGRNTSWRGRIAGVFGERERAVDLLRQAQAEGFGYWPWMRWDVTLDPLRDHPDFQEWLRPKG